jgi:hypothetical protein
LSMSVDGTERTSLAYLTMSAHEGKADVSRAQPYGARRRPSCEMSTLSTPEQVSYR